MTTYTTIPSTDTDANSPVDVSLIERLRDNPLAQFEGAAGAPRLQTAGIEDLAVTSAKLANDTIDAAKIAVGAVGSSELADKAVDQAAFGDYAPGGNTIFSSVLNPPVYDNPIAETSNGVFVVAANNYAVEVTRAGTISVRIGLASSDGTDTVHARVYVNGAAVGVDQSTALTAYQYTTENITVAKNDSVVVRQKVAGITSICHMNWAIGCSTATVMDDASFTYAHF